MGVYMQAVMELGATICTVHQSAACGGCPIRQHCQAKAAVDTYLDSGADPAAAPSVMDYPGKV